MLDSLQYIEHSEIPDTIRTLTQIPMETKMTFFEKFIGTTDISQFTILFVFALIGAFISLRWHVHKRDKRSTATPTLLSWKFMFWDNINRIAVTLLLIFIGIRFSVLLLGSDMTEWGALLLGLGLDKISELLKNATKGARK